MRCKKEEFEKGAVFHIYNHSVREIDLFREKDDYLYFLSKVKDNYDSEKYGIYSYCLMPNHFHFCIRQKSEVPVYSFFNTFITSYAIHYNSKYKRKGKIFAGKLQHKKIEEENYFVGISAYIHLNPVKAGLVDNLSNWEFSNYLEWIGERKGILFDDEILKEYFESAEKYKKWIKENEIEIKKINEYLYSKGKQLTS